MTDAVSFQKVVKLLRGRVWIHHVAVLLGEHIVEIPPTVAKVGDMPILLQTEFNHLGVKIVGLRRERVLFDLEILNAKLRKSDLVGANVAHRPLVFDLLLKGSDEGFKLMVELGVGKVWLRGFKGLGACDLLSVGVHSAGNTDEISAVGSGYDACHKFFLFDGSLNELELIRFSSASIRICFNKNSRNIRILLQIFIFAYPEYLLDENCSHPEANKFLMDLGAANCRKVRTFQNESRP